MTEASRSRWEESEGGGRGTLGTKRKKEEDKEEEGRRARREEEEKREAYRRAFRVRRELK
jgi:hypothetical protein